MSDKTKLSKVAKERKSKNTESVKSEYLSLQSKLQTRQFLLEKHVNYYEKCLKMIKNEKHKLMIEQLQIKAALHQVLTNGDEVADTPNQSNMLTFEPNSVNTTPLSLNLCLPE